MKEQTHGHYTRCALVVVGVDLNLAHIAGVASMAVDACSPDFLEREHHSQFKALGLPVPTALDLNLQQLKDAYHPGWLFLARWHGGYTALRENRRIYLGDHDDLVRRAWRRYLNAETATRKIMIELGAECHGLEDTPTHNGFLPCWDVLNRAPSPKRIRSLWPPTNWIGSVAPAILHAQYLSEPDLINGTGRDNYGRTALTRAKVIEQAERLFLILDPSCIYAAGRKAFVQCIRLAKDDDDLCRRFNDLTATIAQKEPQPLEVWPRGSVEWRDFFRAILEGGL